MDTNMNRGFENRAQLAEETPCRPNECEKCYEPLIFALRSTEQDFSIGLFTILECLWESQKQGAVPKLPDDWWLALKSQFGISLF